MELIEELMHYILLELQEQDLQQQLVLILPHVLLSIFAYSLEIACLGVHLVKIVILEMMLI